jgi:hypothetical protein
LIERAALAPVMGELYAMTFEFFSVKYSIIPYSSNEYSVKRV